MEMESFRFDDGNITNLIDSRTLHDSKASTFKMHSSLLRRLSLQAELQGHQGCVNTIAWNSKGSLLLSGSDDQRINIWGYGSQKLLQSIDTGHSANIFCTKFVPETSDELVVSGAADAEVRLFNLSRLKGSGSEDSAIDPSANFRCHTRRVKKLAVEVGNPNLVWSASEDGTLRQHDFREGASCPPAGSCHRECRNILLDLRNGAKKSLSEPPKQSLALKSCDINTNRPHLLIIGGSDAFARLYDRRMLPPLSSSQNRVPPPQCVNYFSPMHLSDRGRASLHLTHVTFSPNGEEVLLSYSAEHVYLMDTNPGFGSPMRYTSGDWLKLARLNPIPNLVEFQSSASGTFSDGYPAKNEATSRLDMCRKLVQFAEKSLHEGSNCYYGIEACNEVLDGHGHEIGSTLMHECLCIRAELLLKRKWKNDTHMALRDCNKAREINPSSHRALLCMSEALYQLSKHKEALEFAIAAQSLAPSDNEVALKVESIEKQIAAELAEDDKANKGNDGGSKSDHRRARVLSLSEIIYRSEANSDASQDDPRYDSSEESDYDEELELDFETSFSGDESPEPEENIVHGSLSVRIHRRGDSNTRSGQSNEFSEFHSSSNQKCKLTYQPEVAIDIKQRYVGHCNVGTDIKQASFLGQKGEFIASGSDDGRWFIWEKSTGRLVKMLQGDQAVVNCVQCHPSDCAIATSGIDSTIKIWTPSSPVPSLVAGGTAGPDSSNVIDAMEGNHRRLCGIRETFLPYEIFERFRMHELTEGSGSRQCRQT